MLSLRQGTLNHAWELQQFRMTVISLPVADKQDNIHKASGPDRRHTWSMLWLAGGFCLCHFQPLPDQVCTTYMFQADHHSPCAQERQGILSKWISPHSTRICCHEMLWKAVHGSLFNTSSQTPWTRVGWYPDFHIVILFFAHPEIYGITSLVHKGVLKNTNACLGVNY